MLHIKNRGKVENRQQAKSNNKDSNKIQCLCSNQSQLEILIQLTSPVLLKLSDMEGYALFKMKGIGKKRVVEYDKKQSAL